MLSSEPAHKDHMGVLQPAYMTGMTQTNIFQHRTEDEGEKNYLHEQFIGLFSLITVIVFCLDNWQYICYSLAGPQLVGYGITWWVRII